MGEKLANPLRACGKRDQKLSVIGARRIGQRAKSEKDLYLGLGWLMREGKISAEEAEKDFTFSLIG